MRRATTIEFRDAVRAAARDLGVWVARTYTDKSYAETADPDYRRVSFMLRGVAGAEAVARRAEAILAVSGVTARTRIGRVYSCYVRGDCSRVETVAL